MPYNPISGIFTRVWKFIDQFDIDGAIKRSDLDDALDDFVPAVNAALGTLADAENAAAQAQAYAAGAATAGAAAGATAGAAAAVTAAAPYAAAASGSANSAAASAAQAEEYSQTALEVQEKLTTGLPGFVVRKDAATIVTRLLNAGVGIEINDPDGSDANLVFAVKDVPVGKILANGTPGGGNFLRGDGVWAYPAPRFAILVAQTASGVDGPAVPTSWGTLDLNTEKHDDIGVSLSSNKIVFSEAGKYRIKATLVAYNGSGGGRQVQLRIYNVTTLSVLDLGQVTNSSTATPMTLSVTTLASVAAGAEVTIQGQASGSGVLQCDAAGFGDEIGLVVEIERIS